MPKVAVSVTLGDANVLWLKSRTMTRKGRSVSETLDELVTAARTTGVTTLRGMTSVVGTIDIATFDPDLATADAYINTLMGSARAQPLGADIAVAPKTGRRGRRG
jgi:hypothetical protein